MEYAVYTTEKFERELKKLDREYQRMIENLYPQLRENPYVGDQLRYKFLREKRLREKRVYYLVYDELLAVLIVAISDKKSQQETIDHIVSYFDEYHKYLKERIMEG